MGQTNSKSQSKPESQQVFSFSRERKQTSDSKGTVISDKKEINAAHAALVVARVNDCVNLVNIDCLQRFSLDLVALIFDYAYLSDLIRYDLRGSSLPNLGIFAPSPDYKAVCKKAEEFARDHILPAGSLDGLEKAASQNPNMILQPIRIKMALDGIDFILEGSPLQLAIILLDQTIQQAEDSTVPMTDEGQAERLMDLIKRHIPHRMFEAEGQAHLAVSFDDEKTSKAEEEKELKVFESALAKIKANDFDAARNIIWNYIISIKPAVITDNQYFLKLFRLIPRALNFLVAQCKKSKDSEWDWNHADQFCIKTIGTIERLLPHKLRKVLRTELYYMLYQGRNLNRSQDVSDASYLSVGGLELSLNCFFDDFGGLPRLALRHRHAAFSAFLQLMSAITSAQQKLCSDRTLIRRAMP